MTSKADVETVVNKDEYFYLKACQNILDKKREKIDRTGVGTYSDFVINLRFSLRDSTFPLLTTKKLNFRAIALELLWFISGSTDSKVLAKQNINIWNANGSLEFLKKSGFNDRREGDLGPVYGFQWRHWGAEYINCDTNYEGKGIDQLQDLIKKIKENPNDRRLILSAWNVSDLSKMALPPCHCFVQFYVQDNELSCHLYQRSGDMCLGVPFNIASYSLLTHMICHITKLEPGEFLHTIGDAHVYKNHIDGFLTQLKREPREFPKLKIKREVDNIDDFKFEDFEILNYQPHPAISFKMAL